MISYEATKKFREIGIVDISKWNGKFQNTLFDTCWTKFKTIENYNGCTNYIYSGMVDKNNYRKLNLS